jgi:hypothetical protein
MIGMVRAVPRTDGPLFLHSFIYDFHLTSFSPPPTLKGFAASEA